MTGPVKDAPGSGHRKTNVLRAVVAVYVAVTLAIFVVGWVARGDGSTKRDVELFRDGKLGLLPSDKPSSAGTLVVSGKGTLDKTSWLLDASGSTNDIGSSQTATIVLSLVPQDGTAAAPQMVSEEGQFACVGLTTGSFEVDGPATVCSKLTTRDSRGHWAWSLYPRAGTSGHQTVALTLSIRSDDATGATGDTAAVVEDQEIRFIDIDVGRSLPERFAGVVVGFVSALAGILTLCLKTLFDRLAPRNQEAGSTSSSSDTDRSPSL